MSDLIRYMSPHKMASLGAAVSGTVDTSYDNDWLCDGDVRYPVRVASAFSLTASWTSQSVNGAVVANHNLGASVVCTLSGIGTVTTGPVPENLIRLNPWATFSPVTVAGTTLTIPGSNLVVGELFVGTWDTVHGIPPDADMMMIPYLIPDRGEYGGLAIDKSAESRSIAGNIWLTDAEKLGMDAWWRATRNSSLPSILIPFQDLNDAWVVQFESYRPRPYVHPVVNGGVWNVSVAWREIPRYRWQ